ncbi:hypothetical protein ColLi_10878 [Colletotrichum liriopes]|uniref:Uncharacterized protein n=1 Tax=Colletotrichum liriopes TaxID=708192 RepID=A0AA37GVJ4_9PEZI|nr:hypothetical protein ColLi_10878 [Colletotrichum liriopes]
MITPSEPLVLTELPKRKNVKKSGHAGAFTWPERFFVREAIPPLWENTPFFAATLRVRDTDEALEDPVDEDLIHSLKTEENWAPDTYRIESFLDIFQGATLRKLQNGEETVPTDAVALLIDGNNIKGQPRFRSFLGGLSAGGLLNELTKKRYLEDEDVTDEKFIEAERRLM